MRILIVTLLQVNESRGFEAWALTVQTATALAALILALLTRFQKLKIDEQGTKIQDLSKIVTEIKNQNEILEKRFSLEKQTTLMQRVPYFIYHATLRFDDQKRIVVQFRNNGVEAMDITYTSGKYAHYKAHFIEHRRATNEILQVEITEFNLPIEDVEFWITSTSPQHITVTQRVHKFPTYNFKIDPPADPL
jgi:hypothetical protein